jgi:hypothetical protein
VEIEQKRIIILNSIEEGLNQIRRLANDCKWYLEIRKVWQVDENQSRHDPDVIYISETGFSYSGVHSLGLQAKKCILEFLLVIVGLY